MKSSRILSKTAMAAIAISSLAFTTVSAMGPDWAKGMEGVEKCSGIVKKGKNDCGTSKHGCGGKATVDNDAEEWVFMPPGLCDAVGGKIIGAPAAKKEMKKEAK